MHARARACLSARVRVLRVVRVPVRMRVRVRCCAFTCLCVRVFARVCTSVHAQLRTPSRANE